MAFKVAAYLIQHSVQLIPCLNYSIPVIAIHHKNEALSVLKIVPPQWTDLHSKESYICHKMMRHVLLKKGLILAIPKKH